MPIFPVTDDGGRNCLSQLAMLLLTTNVNDANLVEQSREYQEFVQLVEKVSTRHNHHQLIMDVEDDTVTAISVKSYIQHTVADDVVSKILDFLGCVDLIRVSQTCLRLYSLVLKHTEQKTKSMAGVRQLSNLMQLLRAQEQIKGIGTDVKDKCVRIPTLLPRRRVIVSNCGDPEYNGVYFCTGANGNGFIFTKPRLPEHHAELTNVNNGSSAIIVPHGSPSLDSSLVEMDSAEPRKLLRCVIGKRFSNEVSQVSLWHDKIDQQRDASPFRFR